MKKRITYFWFLLFTASILSLFFPRCANVVPPTGGPRDTIPPKVIISSPDNYSTNFTGSEIHIEFDEFIQLRNLNQQFIITPPQKERPDFRARGRNLYITLKSEPIASTTYTLNFGEAIADLNEGNVLRNFEFVFSTGDVIDSLSYWGVVLNAFDNTPVEGVVVMLYDQFYDSLPFREIPLYANRTDQEGIFRLNNLRADTFKVFAVEDANNNYLYDRPGEERIAFLDDYIFPFGTEEMFSENEYIIADTTNNGINSLQFPEGDTLYLFREETGRQRILRNERPHRGELLFVFNRPLQNSWAIEPLNFTPPSNWKLIEVNPAMDSLRYWITDQETRDINNMRFLVSYRDTGPSDSLILISDSLNMNYSPPARSARQPVADQAENIIDANFGIPAGGNQDLYRNLKLSFPAPLGAIDFSKIALAVVNDIEDTTVGFELINDSLRIRNYLLETDWIPGTDYRFVSLPGAFTDIFDRTTDSIEFAFSTREEDYYGRLLLNVSGVQSNIIIQLMGERENVLREFYIDEDREILIDFLGPQKYRLKAIFDRNNNKKWDPGNYLKGIQPERVRFYDDIIGVRSNWDAQLDWDLQD